MNKKKKGLSPVITTVILIGLVIAIVSIVFFWFRGMVEEGVTKFGKNIELVCEDINFKATYDKTTGKLSIINDGNIHLYSISMKIINNGNYETQDLRDTLLLPNGLKPGEAEEITIGEYTEGSLELTPILMGKSEKGNKMFICGGQYGKNIEI